MTTGTGRITLQEAATRLGVHYMTAYRYVRTGRLPGERSGANWLVDPAALDRLGPAAPSAPRPPRGTARAEAPGRLAARLVAGDEAGAWHLVETALTSGLDPDEVYLDLLVPALRGVGDGWADGRLGVNDEHRASGVAVRLIGRLGPRFARRGRKRGTVVLGAPPGEEHGLPCAIVADLLRAARFDVVDLGADTPAASFAAAAAGADRLVAVLIGATTSGRDAALRSTVRALRRRDITAPILVGGAAIAGADHAARLGADGWTGHDGRAVVAAVEQLTGRPPR